MKASANYMPPEQFALVLDNIPRLNIRKWSIVDVQMLFKIAYWCGLRITEACNLQVHNFDLDFKRVYLGKTKTNANDRATIPDKFIVELSGYLLGKEGYLFPDMNRFIVYNWQKRLGIILNIEAWTTPQSVTREKTKTHIFRKSVGKDMLYGTIDGVRQPINIVQRKLRHSNPTMTALYLKALDDDVEAVGW